MVLFCNDDYTFPKANQQKLDKLNDELNKVKYSLVPRLRQNIGNVINVYNVFQHFYPYFDVVDVDWEAELKKAIKRSYTDNDKQAHLITLQKFTAALQDGHIWVSQSKQTKYMPTIAWEWIENKLVITQVEGKNDSIRVGDIVTHIDGMGAQQYFNEINSRISAATEGWLNYRAQTESLKGAYRSALEVTIAGNVYDLKRTVNINDWRTLMALKKDTYKELEPDVWYLNLDIVEMDTINRLLPQLKGSKGIICDMRGYPKSNHGIIQHLLAIDDTTSAWMQTPQIVYPDHKRVVGYKKHNWMGFMTAKKPYLGDKKVVFITDGRAISYAESFMGYIEGYQLATIIGQPTAGTNGNVNPFSLPGGYSISWTGMKVVKHDGTQHHGIGIVPDIYIDKTIQGIIEGRDEYLEKALELVNGEI